MSRWAYVGLTAILAAVVAAWAIPKANITSFSVGYFGTEPGAPVPLPTLSFDTFVIGDSAQLLLLAVGVGLLVQLYSVAYLGEHPRYRSYALIIVLFLLGMIAVVATDNLWVLLIGWEVMGLCSYVLIGHDWERREARAGAAKAFLVTRVADLALVLAILVIGQTYGTYSILGTWLEASDHPRNATAIGLLVLIAVIGKSAQFPLQSWLPDAMPGPTPITALIHAATMVAAGVFLLVRLFPLYSMSTVVVTSMAVVAMITMLLGAVMALGQTDLKRALAWSTVSQLALMIAAVAASDPGAAIDHLVAHGAFKALLFLGCGCVMHAVGTSALSAMGGLRRVMPVTFWTMTIGFAALAGVVPTVGFFTKDGVLEALHTATDGDGALSGGAAWVALVVAVLTSFITALYAMRLWLLTFFGDAPTSDQERLEPHEAPWTMAGPLVVLAVATLALSIGKPFHLGMGILSTVVAAAGIVTSYAMWKRVPGLRVRTRGLERAIDAPISRWIPAITRGASRLVLAVDDDGVDAYSHGGAAGARLASRGLDLVQSRNVQRYATVMAAGVVVLVIAAVIAS